MKHSLKEQVKGSLVRPLGFRVATGLSPTFKIPLITSPASVPSGIVSTYTRNSTATYIEDGLIKTAGMGVIRFQNGRYLCELAATNRFLQSGTPATQMITVVSGTVYTVQCYGSGSITLSGAGTGSVIEGAPRTFTASSTSLICAVSGSLNRAQVETGTQATSYIPTTTVTMTRDPDVLNYAVGDVITQGQGSLYCEFVGNNVSANRGVLTLSDGSYSNRIYLYIDALNKSNFVGCIGGAFQLVVVGPYILLSLNKILVCYNTLETKCYFNGVLVFTDTSFTIPTGFSTLLIGALYGNASQLSSEIGNVKYFKEALTEAEAIKLTTI